MKLLREYTQDVQPQVMVEVLQEETGETCLVEASKIPVGSKPVGAKQYFIEGVMVQAEIKNKNGRIYPKSSIDAAIKRYNTEQVQANRALGELGHPDHPNVNLERAACRIMSLTMQGNDVIGKAKILDTPCGKIVKGLIDEGVKFGVSSRGVGSTTKTDRATIVGDDFLITAIDIVHDPSAPKAFMDPLFEGKEWKQMEDGTWVEMMKESSEQLDESKKVEQMRAKAAARDNPFEMMVKKDAVTYVKAGLWVVARLTDPSVGGKPVVMNISSWFNQKEAEEFAKEESLKFPAPQRFAIYNPDKRWVASYQSGKPMPAFVVETTESIQLDEANKQFEDAYDDLKEAFDLMTQAKQIILNFKMPKTAKAVRMIDTQLIKCETTIKDAWDACRNFIQDFRAGELANLWESNDSEYNAKLKAIQSGQIVAADDAFIDWVHKQDVETASRIATAFDTTNHKHTKMMPKDRYLIWNTKKSKGPKDLRYIDDLAYGSLQEDTNITPQTRFMKEQAFLKRFEAFLSETNKNGNKKSKN